ncbi:hypothetical protein [Rubrobacter indicoceani]|uniref:hypothetical protein n=1 Tax=Rubrobacter indicoceani TaxID=2051957 RepID=UPI000E5BCFC0|nr:hypothetical protein [Rubrobacter indicoceani]
MIVRVKKSWRLFRASDPGLRFSERYQRRQREDGSRWRSPLNVVLGAVIALVSLSLGWAPGPGMLTFFLCLWLIAGELYPAARLMDRSEVGLRVVLRAFGRFWGRAPRGQRTAVAVGLIALGGLFLALVLRFFTG